MVSNRQSPFPRGFPVGRRSCHGFTLIELVVVIVVMGILFGMAGPAFQDMADSQKVRNAATTLHSSLTLARAEAIKRNSAVNVRPAASETWEDGWLIPNPASPASDANPLLREQLTGGVKITTSLALISFSPSGRVAAGGSGDLELESLSNPDNKRCVSISLSGHASVKGGGC